MASLTKAQEKTLKRIYTDGYISMGTIHTATRKVLGREKLIEWTGSIYVLTEAGKALAEQLFGTPDPAPVDASEPPLPFELYFHDQRFATPTLVESGSMDEILPMYREFCDKNEYAEIKRGGVMVVFPKLPFEFVGHTEPPQTGIQWRKVTDLPAPAIAYWNQLTGYVWLQDRAETRQNAHHAFKKRTTAKYPLNMQKRREQPTQRQIQPTQRETVLQIVSRLRTPLTSQVRRIA